MCKTLTYVRVNKLISGNEMTSHGIPEQKHTTSNVSLIEADGEK